jgi:hypothetical protein
MTTLVIDGSSCRFTWQVGSSQISYRHRAFYHIFDHILPMPGVNCSHRLLTIILMPIIMTTLWFTRSISGYSSLKFRAKSVLFDRRSPWRETAPWYLPTVWRDSRHENAVAGRINAADRVDRRRKWLFHNIPIGSTQNQARTELLFISQLCRATAFFSRN